MFKTLNLVENVFTESNKQPISPLKRILNYSGDAFMHQVHTHTLSQHRTIVAQHTQSINVLVLLLCLALQVLVCRNKKRSMQ